MCLLYTYVYHSAQLIHIFKIMFIAAEAAVLPAATASGRGGYRARGRRRVRAARIGAGRGGAAK
jgi:hypothetical protein